MKKWNEIHGVQKLEQSNQRGRKGGQATSPAKAQLSRNNGKKGGRPKKSQDQQQTSMSK